MPRRALNFEEHGVRYAGLDRSAVGSGKCSTALALSRGVVCGSRGTAMQIAPLRTSKVSHPGGRQRLIFWTTHSNGRPGPGCCSPVPITSPTVFIGKPPTLPYAELPALRAALKHIVRKPQLTASLLASRRVTSTSATTAPRCSTKRRSIPPRRSEPSYMLSSADGAFRCIKIIHYTFALNNTYY
jgi:hypothetical protein